MVEISLSGISSGSWEPFHDGFIPQVGEKLLYTLGQLESYERLIGKMTSDFALTLTPEVNTKTLAPWVDKLKMVELTVENFTDGRAFTQARVLRDIGFKGEIKVSGPIVPDQAKFFARVGVDTLRIEDASRAVDFKSALDRFNVFYQSSSDGVSPVYKLRHMKVDDINIVRKAS